MYQKRWENSNAEQIKNATCYLPPEGYIFNHFTGELQDVGIYKRSRSKSEQFWEIDRGPEEYEERHKKEIKAKLNKDLYIDPVCEEWRNKQWLHRLGGFWFYNNGIPTYITGKHWFQLSYWSLSGRVKRSKYRERDRKFWYFFEWVYENPNALGLIYATRRREGKTVKSCVAMYEEMSRRQDFRGGIQSKTEDDAIKVVFRDGLVYPWQRMVDFFCPEYDQRQSKRPTQLLRFNELNSEVTAKSSVESAYDGERLDFYIGDEIFKTKVNIRERHDVVVPTLTDENDDFYGFAMYTSTVEDIAGYVEEYKKLWDESDPENLDANKQTESGLFQYFVGAHEARKHDIYGFENIAANKQYYVNRRAAARDPRKLASITRKYPFTIEEAFMSTSGGTLVHLLPLINQQISNISTYQDDLILRGDFVWMNGEKDTEVIFKEHEGGKFHVLKKWIKSFSGGKFYKQVRGRSIA